MRLFGITIDPLFVFMAAVLLLALVIYAGVTIGRFQRELRYLNNEIKRTEGEERRMWMRLRRRLWLSLLPFYRY